MRSNRHIKSRSRGSFISMNDFKYFFIERDRDRHRSGDYQNRYHRSPKRVKS